jgi:HSP20 family protein
MLTVNRRWFCVEDEVDGYAMKGEKGMNSIGWTYWERLFECCLLPTCWSGHEPREAKWHPLVDIYDHEKAIIMSAELPGVDREAISVDVNDRVLTLRGMRSPDKGVQEESYRRRERALGAFERSFRLPDEVDSDMIKATYKDGVLTIRIPKLEAEKPRQITIH